MSNPKPTRLYPGVPLPEWTIADVTQSERSLGRSRWWMWTGTHWMAVGALQTYRHDEFAHLFREAVLRVPREHEDRLVATLRTPIPVDGLNVLAANLQTVYGDGLTIMPFEEGEFARVEFGPRGNPRRTRRTNDPEPRLTAPDWESDPLGGR